MSRPSRPFIFVVTICAATAIVGGAIAGVSAVRSLSHSSPMRPVANTRDLTYTPAVSSGTPLQMIAAISRRVGQTSIQRATISTSGRSLELQVAVPDKGPAAIKGTWEGQVVEGSIAESLSYSQQDRLTNERIVGVLPDGSTIPLVNGMGNVAAGQRFSSPSDSSIRSAVVTALNKVGGQLISFRVLHADQPAPEIVASFPSAASAHAAAGQLAHDLFFTDGHPIYEGYYLELRDSHGQMANVAAVSFREGDSSYWSSDPTSGDAESLP